MAPNRKSNTDIVDSLQVDASFLVQSKYAPLTASTQPEPSSDDGLVVHAPHSLDATHPAQSYWNWPAQEDMKEQLIARILEEERVRQLMSISHVEENLTRALPRKTEENVERMSPPEKDHDYWFQPSEDYTPTPCTTQVQPSYWDWPTLTEEGQRQLLIQQILEEEACRQIFSVTHIQDNLMTKQQQAEPTRSTPLAGSVVREGSCYWNW